MHHAMVVPVHCLHPYNYIQPLHKEPSPSHLSVSACKNTPCHTKPPVCIYKAKHMPNMPPHKKKKPRYSERCGF